ncbi:carbonic anhydrase [Sodiomyces alkalinus F11]|uniref:Carbonic anhydrase n=1 Tax=Sodiomyces alkalinus (strain CBS 110278 / VKM F-3762 / F11) TaxID=1314773 RepID=A0A3N2Q9A0_SODAK|nr:carbonic anhydrase [Sodiomyces alkalinus F11]ROT43344.1 carbonic anhydrase [Sodiomyces alkalinus F11]
MTYPNDDEFLYALSSNQAWASYKSHQNPAFFKTLTNEHAPSILWIGCADSRVPETTILGLPPGAVFVHRNFANIISPTDINTAAVIEHAVVNLKVKHIILCGHSACDGARATLTDSRAGGVLETWLTSLRVVRAQLASQLATIRDDHTKEIMIAEKNVEVGVAVLMANSTVQEHIKSRGLEVHGCFFDISSGRIRDLGLGTRMSTRRAPSTNGTAETVRGKHAQLVFREGGVAGMEAR